MIKFKDDNVSYEINFYKTNSETDNSLDLFTGETVVTVSATYENARVYCKYPIADILNNKGRWKNRPNGKAKELIFKLVKLRFLL